MSRPASRVYHRAEFHTVCACRAFPGYIALIWTMKFTPGMPNTRRLVRGRGELRRAGAVRTVDPKTGFVTPFAVGFTKATGMVFVPTSAPEGE